MIGPAAAARVGHRRPGRAIALAVVIALATVWLCIAASYHTNWPLGFFVGVAAPSSTWSPRQAAAEGATMGPPRWTER